MKARTTLPVNVHFFSAVVYHALGIPADFYADNRLIRPRAEYLGHAPRPLAP